MLVDPLLKLKLPDVINSDGLEEEQHEAHSDSTIQQLKAQGTVLQTAREIKTTHQPAQMCSRKVQTLFRFSLSREPPNNHQNLLNPNVC